jgi:hypothetical protein
LLEIVKEVSFNFKKSKSNNVDDEAKRPATLLLEKVKPKPLNIIVITNSLAKKPRLDDVL